LGDLLGDFLVVFVGDLTIMCFACIRLDCEFVYGFLASVFLRGAASVLKAEYLSAELITIREYKKFICPRS